MGEVIDISGDDEIRSMLLGDYRHHRILEILELESSRLPPTIRVEIADLKMIQQPIHRRFGMRFRGMLANQIVESCESMRRKKHRSLEPMPRSVVHAFEKHPKAH